VSVHVKGIAQLQTFLNELPAKLERNALRGAMRAAVLPVKAAAVANIQSQSGALASSLKVSTRVQGGLVTAKLRSKLFYARFVEYGTRPHSIAARNRKSLSLGGFFLNSVDHPGARPRPFMRPALDTQASAALTAAAEYLKARLATKHGLDTSDVQIGEES
jgi:HK97 gp10 family phage protein